MATATATDRLQRHAERFQDYLDRLKKQQGNKFNKVMLKLDANTQKLLRAIDGPMNEVKRGRMERLIHEMSKANRLDLDDATNEFLDTLQSFAMYSYEIEGSTLATLTTAGDAVAVAKSATTVYNAAKLRPLSATGDLLEPFVKELGVRQAAILEKTIRKGVANGWTSAETSRLLRGTKAADYKDGVMSKLGRQTQTVVNTAMQHVNNVSRQVIWEENSDIVVGYRWVSTLDDRTSDICIDLDGEVFKLGEGPVPPAHPNCRSTTVAELDDAFDILDKGATRSSEEGYVPMDMSYGEWLAENEEE